MRSSVVISAVVAAIVGFGGSLAVVLAAAQALGATEAETASWVTASCLAMVFITGVLSVRHRMPIIAAWSTPGAALIAATSGVTMPEAVAAFLLAGVLILLTAAFRVVGDLIERIPSAIASAMLAGVLFQFVVAVMDHVTGAPMLVLPLLAIFLVVRLFSPMWAVLVVLAAGAALAFGLGMVAPLQPPELSRLVWIAPEWDLGVLIGMGVPLYLVTMASQNLPGFAVLRAAGYAVPSRSILGISGLASVVTAFAGTHTSNLAAITASICTGPDTHPDPEKRWLAGPFYAGCYLVFAVFGASLVGLFAALPVALIVTVAGVALLGPFIGAAAAGFGDERVRFAAAVTFVVTASGVNAFGIGAAFWGLVAGLLVLGLESVAKGGVGRA